MSPLVPALFFAALWIFLIIRTFWHFRNENKRIKKQLADDHDKNIKATILDVHDLPGRELDLFECHEPFLGYVKNLN